MSETPTYLQDAKALLSKDGFATGDVWYHGTSSALVDAIMQSGLIRSGDQAMNQAAKNTMATIGNSYAESREPIFLTQSKELAYYWATQAVKRRSVRFEGDELPAVLEVKLDSETNKKVRPDVGARSLLMVKEGENFLAFVTKLYQDCDAGVLDIDLMKADRDDFLNKLGMAYFDEDIAVQNLRVLKD